MPSGLHRSHAVLAALVVLAAAWAYWTAQPGAGKGGSEQPVTVWEVPLRDIASLTYRDGDARTVVHSAWDEGDKPLFWVEARETVPPPRGKPHQRAPKPPGREAETSTFKGGAAVQSLLESIATLTAVRDLGPLDELDAGQFGLPAQGAALELARTQGEPLRLELGRTGFGGNTRYVHEPAGGHLYLLRTTELRRLASARGSLMDRDLLGLKLDEAARIELSDGARSAVLHKLAEAGAWGTTAAADAGNADAAALVKGLQGLSVLRYLDEGHAEPGPPALEARVFLAGETGPAGWVRLYGGEGTAVQARSAYTRRMVEVPADPVRQVLERARALLQGN